MRVNFFLFFRKDFDSDKLKLGQTNISFLLKYKSRTLKFSTALIDIYIYMLKQSNVFKQSSIPAREPRELHTITFYKKKGK